MALIVVALAGGAFAYRIAGQKSAAATDATQRFGQQAAPLASLSKQLGQVLGDTNVLTVNGQLHVAGTLVLDPTVKPANPTTGQIYYDQASNSLGYYNGKGFVYLQGGGNTFVTNNITNAGPVTNNVTNVTNITNTGGGGVNGSGTPGAIAMFTAAGALGDSVITQSGTSLTVGSNAGASSTTIQGGTAGVLIATAPAAGTGGGITIQSGASSTTASGNVTIDTGAGVINGTVVGNKDFEDGTTDFMVDGFGFTAGITNSTAQAHLGTHSLAITMGNDGSYEIGEQAPYHILAQPGHSYRFSAWVKAGSVARTFTFQTEFSSTGFSGGGSLGLYGWGTVTDSAGSWKQVSGTLVAPANTIDLAIAITSGFGIPNGEVHYIDDITVTDLNSAVAVSQLNLGATNAQQVTLGNVNQIQPTSIYGAGINMSGGLGVTNISGGFFNLSATGASTISTGTGSALNVTSGGTASWGVSSNLFGGSLTVHSGNSGGNNNGGDLILQSGAGSGTGVSGNITVDGQPSPVSGTLIDNRGFETGTENMLAATNTTVAQTNAAVHSGGFSLASTSTAAGIWQVSQDQGSAGITITAGHQYYFSAWVRANATPETVHSFITWLGHGVLNLNPVTESGSTWMHLTGIGTAPAGTTAAFWNFTGTDAGGNVQYMDDLEVTDLSAATSVSSLNLGANWIQGVNLGNQQQVSTTTIQGGAGINIDSAASALNLSGGNVSVVTPNDIGTTGNINISSGASSTTASGNVTIDTGAGVVSGTIVDNRDFESGTDAMTAWFGDTVTQTSAQAHGGIESFAETGTAGSFWGIIQDGNVSTIPIVAGHHYFFSAWVRAATTPNSIGGSVTFDAGGSVTLSTVTDTTTGWTHMTGSGVAPAGATFGIWRFSGTEAPGETHYFDDLVTTDLSSSSAVSELDLGSTNAQIITIGNMNEIGATTINGGSGITMNSGQANFTINGGAINVTGSGASLLQTTAGALNLTAAATSTWSINSSGNGGDLTLQAGSSNSASNAGNLVLQPGANTGTGSPGAVIVRPQTDSTTAFQIQNATNTPLLTADTSSMTITVQQLVVTANLTVNGHIVTGGTTPGIAAGAAACTGPTVSIAGTDTSGTITITTGTGCTAGGLLATVTFAGAYAAAPHVTITPGGPGAQTLGAYVDDSTVSTTAFNLGTTGTPANTTTYKWNYWTAQ